MSMYLNGKKVIDVAVDGVDMKDYPDFCDAYFYTGFYEDGTELTDIELEELMEEYPEIVNEMAYASVL